MEQVVIAAAVFLVGALGGWMIGRRNAEKLRLELNAANQRATAAETRLSAITESEERLRDAFGKVAADALSRNNENFLALAQTKFGELKTTSEADLESRKQEIQTLVQQLRTSVEGLTGETKRMEGDLGRWLQLLQSETTKLANALSAPKGAGDWGEMQLRRVVELSGMTEHFSFSEQQTIATEDGRLRPDMIVFLPAGREIVVDSKVPTEAFKRAFATTETSARKNALAEHAKAARAHMKSLVAKKYWEQFPRSPDFVVMFFPSEALLAAAAEIDPSFIADALTERVAIATPSTLFALLRAVEKSWMEVKRIESAQQISDVGRDLYDRILVFLQHFAEVGSGLKSAIEAYNRAAGSAESRLVTGARRFREMGIDSKRPAPQLELITETPRTIAASAGDE